MPNGSNVHLLQAGQSGWRLLDDGAKTGRNVLLLDRARGEESLILDKWEGGDWSWWLSINGPAAPTHYIPIPPVDDL
jgi:hypothetical protein